MHCVDLGESFLNLLFELDSYSNEYLLFTSIYLQNLASMQPRTSLVKFARSPCTETLSVIESAVIESPSCVQRSPRFRHRGAPHASQEAPLWASLATGYARPLSDNSACTVPSSMPLENLGDVVLGFIISVPKFRLLEYILSKSTRKELT